MFLILIIYAQGDVGLPGAVGLPGQTGDKGDKVQTFLTKLIYSRRVLFLFFVFLMDSLMMQWLVPLRQRVCSVVSTTGYPGQLWGLNIKEENKSQWDKFVLCSFWQSFMFLSQNPSETQWCAVQLLSQVQLPPKSPIAVWIQKSLIGLITSKNRCSSN